mgnify:CR=1 FL=1
MAGSADVANDRPEKCTSTKASAILFLKGRLSFCSPDGTPAKHNSGGPSCLVAYGDEAAERLWTNRDLGKFLRIAK